MSSALRALCPLLVLLAAALPARAEPMPADTAPLEFHGFRAGATLAELQTLLTALDGGRLRCDRRNTGDEQHHDPGHR